MRKLNVSLQPTEVLKVDRVKLGNNRLVYVLLVNKRVAWRIS